MGERVGDVSSFFPFQELLPPAEDFSFNPKNLQNSDQGILIHLLPDLCLLGHKRSRVAQEGFLWKSSCGCETNHCASSKCSAALDLWLSCHPGLHDLIFWMIADVMEIIALNSVLAEEVSPISVGLCSVYADIHFWDVGFYNWPPLDKLKFLKLSLKSVSHGLQHCNFHLLQLSL